VAVSTGSGSVDQTVKSAEGDNVSPVHKDPEPMEETFKGGWLYSETSAMDEDDSLIRSKEEIIIIGGRTYAQDKKPPDEFSSTEHLWWVMGGSS
jgi:hypothetical protein